MKPRGNASTLALVQTNGVSANGGCGGLRKEGDMDVTVELTNLGGRNGVLIDNGQGHGLIVERHEAHTIRKRLGEVLSIEHCAWLVFKRRDGSDQSYLSLCDSDTPGAFKVYR